MSTQTKDQISVGRNLAVNVLTISAAAHGEEVARAMAAGLVTGIRDFIVARYGTRDAYELLQAAADSCVTSVPGRIA